MKPVCKGSASITLLVLSGLLALKGMELRALGTNVDGAGIGVYFLSFEINDRVAEMDIPGFAIGFSIASGATALAAFKLLITGFFKPNERKTYKKV